MCDPTFKGVVAQPHTFGANISTMATHIHLKKCMFIVSRLHAARCTSSRVFSAWRAQERIRSDGSLTDSTLRESEEEIQRPESYVIGSAVQGAHTTVPEGVPPVTCSQLDVIVDFIRESSRGTNPITGRKRYCVAITGAGISTESGIPDYRSANGAYSRGFKPMTHQQFMACEENRKRYWARSYAGWNAFSAMNPNEAHIALAQLQKNGYIEKIITQNVDRLHQKGGADPHHVLELHGTTHEVMCTSCFDKFPRDTMQEWLSSRNKSILDALNRLNDKKDTVDERRRLALAGTSAPVRSDLHEQPQQNPDGDVEVDTSKLKLSVPSCPSCYTGVLKPDVVFFGDSLPPERSQQSLDIAKNASGILVVGSSVAVMSAYRLVKEAKKNGASVCIITAGETRADDIADVKFNLLAGEVLPMVSARLTSVPNV